MRFEVVAGDATRTPGDVLALKFAQARYGLDAHVAKLLAESGRPDSEMSPRPGSFRILPSPNGVAARAILFVGVKRLYEFEYEQIRVFARKVLASLATGLPETQSILVTLHGPGYGLDEYEAFESEIAGFVDGIQAGEAPPQLELIRFVELDEGRAKRLRQVLAALFPGREAGRRSTGQRARSKTPERLRSVGYASASKPHVFVAMPFADDTEDVYHYGIYNAVNSTGWLCERADLSAFTGDVTQWVQQRIKSASLLVAELSGANPNVYLEVGFAWGCGVPTVLLARRAQDLQFDVRGQRCLVYKTIKELEAKLSEELKQLAP